MVSDGLCASTYKDDSKTSIGSDLQRGCKRKCTEYRISDRNTIIEQEGYCNHNVKVQISCRRAKREKKDNVIIC
jgi:hypothetical protein